MNLIRYRPTGELDIVAVIASAIFGPHTLWRMRRRSK
jgi:hypothetical protein